MLMSKNMLGRINQEFYLDVLFPKVSLLLLKHLQVVKYTSNINTISTHKCAVANLNIIFYIIFKVNIASTS